MLAGLGVWSIAAMGDAGALSALGGVAAIIGAVGLGLSRIRLDWKERGDPRAVDPVSLGGYGRSWRRQQRSIERRLARARRQREAAAQARARSAVAAGRTKGGR